MMNRSKFTDDDLAAWRDAWDKQCLLEARAEKARDEGDAPVFVALLNELEEVRTRADLLLASAVELRCARQRLQRWFADDASAG